MHPQPRVRDWDSKYAHEYSQRLRRNRPALPAQWFTAYGVFSPAVALPPSPVDRSTDLALASGRQDHTFLPSALGTFVRGALRVHRSPLRVDDVRATPLWSEPDDKRCRLICYF